MECIHLGLFVALIGGIFGWIAYDKLIGCTLTCRYLGWHNGNAGAKSFDGLSIHARCDKCGKEVMQDGQGNWF